MDDKTLSTLFRRATDGREPLLDPAELSALWEAASAAMHGGRYRAAFMATEALLSQADRGARVSDELPDPRLTACGKGYTAEMIQGFVDRVEALNSRVRWS